MIKIKLADCSSISEFISRKDAKTQSDLLLFSLLVNLYIVFLSSL